MVSVPFDANQDSETAETRVQAPLYVLPPDGIDLAEVERSFVEQALEMAHGNQSQAARFLGITRFALRSRIKRHHLRDKVKVHRLDAPT